MAKAKKTAPDSAPAPQPVEFQLTAITTEQFATFMERFSRDTPITSEPTLRFSSDKARRAVAVFVRVTHTQAGEDLLVLEVGSHFQFSEGGWASLLDASAPGDAIRLSRELAAHLSFLAMGTLRGVQYEKTLGLDCGRLILPLINVAEAMTEDIIL